MMPRGQASFMLDVAIKNLLCTYINININGTCQWNFKNRWISPSERRKDVTTGSENFPQMNTAKFPFQRKSMIFRIFVNQRELQNKIRITVNARSGLLNLWIVGFCLEKAVIFISNRFKIIQYTIHHSIKK